MGKLEHSDIAGKNTKWYDLIGKLFFDCFL